MTEKREYAKHLNLPPASNELGAVFAALEKINHRLDRLERASSTETSTLRSHHPSQERFEIAEAVADVIFNGIKKEKTCTFEPNSRPCDHCAMCSARGF